MHSAAKDVIGLYRRHALAWTRARGTTLIEGAWLERFCSLLPTRPALVDIGCGSGKPIARHLIERGVEVTGVDSSPEMMALFAHNFPSYSAQVVDMRTLSLSRRFDGLLAWNSFFHLSHADQRGVFPVFREHSAPSAVLMFTSGPSHGGPSVASKVNHCTTLASMTPSIVRCSTSFDVVAHVTEDPTCGGLTIWLAQLR
jgi:SAM-dependent methyltransferase